MRNRKRRAARVLRFANSRFSDGRQKLRRALLPDGVPYRAGFTG
jgi:hypothetical protein